MSVATLHPGPGPVGREQRFVVDGLGFDDYEAIDRIIGGRRNVRLIFVEGRLTFVTASRRHEWFAERLAELVKIVASTLRIAWEDAGSATYRRRDKEVGVEGDKTFYLGPNALIMRGPVNIDLANQPPPDLAIEVEVTNPADDSLLVYGRLGISEVWRFDVDAWTLTIGVRREDGTYAESTRSHGLPPLEAADVPAQLKLAGAMGADPWFDQLRDWARVTLLPRLGGG